ncbi:nucleolar complex protein 4 homolog A-like [Gigantopelta aegis]|uniref:nucleolar complex protein 4 homolog A-like n=1 Tax=Gigantopelta aegis TaxID=1735272 RepID=UPI001B887E62|nr:nucleolar complex protein 4 homolog A-like [Gigantopelta aegis]
MDVQQGTQRSKEIVLEIKEKSKLCIESRKHINGLVDILGNLQSSNENVIVASIHGLHSVFHHFLSTSEMYSEVSAVGEDITGLSKAEQYKLWLRQHYVLTCNGLVDLLHHSSYKVQELSMTTLMKFIKDESHNPLQKPTQGHTFPEQLFKRLFLCLIPSDKNMQPLFMRFQEYTEFDDVRYFCMQCLNNSLKKEQVSSEQVTDVYLSNIFACLENLNFTEEASSMSNFLSPLPEQTKQTKLTDWREHRKLFTNVWILFLSFKLTTGLYKKVLMILHDKVIPYVSCPLFLSDFLTESYNVGGAISLLALNGLFLLVSKYNLDYPDFYKKLYALFEPSIFHVKYRSRFFYLANMFLSSTHLPAYLVASFAKKLSRILLTAPSSGLRLAIPFMLNLVIRHPNLKVMLNRTNGPTDITSDPYNYDETDPGKSKALDSCLWELKTLQSHYCPDIVSQASRIEHPLSTTETDLSELLDITEDEMVEKEVKKKKKDIPLTFEPPKGLFDTKDDKMQLCWSLQ